MSVLLIGSKGSMGRRYSSILAHLRKEFVGIDAETTREEMLSYVKNSSHVIIATPTETHLDLIESLNTSGKPILCEKPLSKNLLSLEALLHECKRYKTTLSMVFQYAFLPGATESREGLTRYDHYNHGNDGLIWDCIQIIGLATGKIELAEKSPYWECEINGKPMSLGDMPGAYVKAISSWLRQPGQDLGKLYDLHVKVSEYENSLKAKVKHELRYH